MFKKEKVFFEGNTNNLVEKHKGMSFAKKRIVEVPKGYEVILFEADGTAEIIKNELEFKLSNPAKYIYYVKNSKVSYKGSWGTTSRIQVETDSGLMTLGGYGNLEYKLSNAIRFVNTHLQNAEYIDEETLTSMVLDKLPELFQLALSTIENIDENKVTDLTLELKSKVFEMLSKKLNSNGIELTDFIIENINLQKQV